MERKLDCCIASVATQAFVVRIWHETHFRMTWPNKIHVKSSKSPNPSSGGHKFDDLIDMRQNNRETDLL